jgi:hypothetical protein
MKGKRGLTAASSRREAIAGGLGECPAGRWIATDEFVRHLQASGNNFEVTRDACGSLGYDGSARILNERYVFAVLLEYAATLGIIDVALIPPAGARRDLEVLEKEMGIGVNGIRKGFWPGFWVGERGGQAQMKRINRSKADPIERQIEVALHPGAFIRYGECFSFVSGLEKVAATIGELIKTEPARSVAL